MLQNIREKFTGTFAIVILALICIPFVFFGIRNLPFGHSFAARVDGVEISTYQLDNVYRNELSRYAQYGELPLDFRRRLKTGVLDSLIRNTLVDNYLADAGFRVSDQMVTDIIQRQPEFQVDGKFSKDKYYAFLQERAVDPTLFETSQRRNLRRSQLQRGVGGTAFVTPADFRRYLNLYGEQRRVAIATFDVAKVGESVEVTDDDVQAYYDERPTEFQTPESVDFNYVELRRDLLAQQAEISEAELQQHYEESANRYRQDEERRASHILIPFGDDEEAAEEQARALTARAQAGEPFADLARQYSKDGGTAEQGGDLGYHVQSQMPGALGDAIFSMRKGEIRGPVRSEFGFHIVRLDDIKEGGPLPLDQVRGELERELRDRKADDAYRQLERAISDALFDATDLEAIAKKVGLEVKSAHGFTRMGGEPFGTNQAAIDAVFDPKVLTEHQISDLVEIDANRSVVLQVAEYHEAARKPLAEVRDQIVEALKRNRAQSIIQERADKLQTDLRDGAEFEAAATAAGAAATPYAVIERTDEDLDSRVLEAIYRAKKPVSDVPRIGSQMTVDGNYAVFSIDEVMPGRPEAVPLAERDQRKEALANQAGAADYTAFILQLEREADIVRSEDALDVQDQFE